MDGLRHTLTGPLKYYSILYGNLRSTSDHGFKN